MSASSPPQREQRWPWAMRAVLGTLLLAAMPACQLGEGVGAAAGPLEIARCDIKDDVVLPFPPPNEPGKLFDLTPSFFVGEPIDSLVDDYPNAIVIRIQRSALRLEFADALVFYVLDSGALARCVRRRIDPATGAPDWDPRLCDNTGPENRTFIGTEHEVVRAFLTVTQTCPATLTTASALGACDDLNSNCPTQTLCPSRNSWISFADFGTLPSDPAQSIPRDFAVAYGDRIRATAFHVELCDLRTVKAQMNGEAPVPESRMTGVLEGRFDFDLYRSQRL